MEARSAQGGQAIHLNFAPSYALNAAWRLREDGYYLTQISSNKVNDDTLPGAKEQVFAVGPGLSYSNKGHFLNINFYKESGAENRIKGEKLTLRYSKVW